MNKQVSPESREQLLGYRDKTFHEAGFCLYNSLEDYQWQHPRSTVQALEAFRIHIKILPALELINIGLLFLTFFEKPHWSIQNIPSKFIDDSAPWGNASIWTSEGGGFPGDGSRFPSWGVPFLDYHRALHVEITLFCLLAADLLLVIYAQGADFLKHIRMKERCCFMVLYFLDLAVSFQTPATYYRCSQYVRVLLFVNSFPATRDKVILTLQTLKNSFSLLMLTFYSVFFFAWMGMVIFDPTTAEAEAEMPTLALSMWNIYMLFTTANFPDVMMPGYDVHRETCLFFIVFLMVGVWFLGGMITGVVFETYQAAQQTNSMLKLQYQQEQVRKAYNILEEFGHHGGWVCYKDVTGALHQLKRYAHINHVLDDEEIVKALDGDHDDKITQEEFERFGAILAQSLKTNHRLPPWGQPAIIKNRALFQWMQRVSGANLDKDPTDRAPFLFETLMVVLLVAGGVCTAARTWPMFNEHMHAIVPAGNSIVSLADVTSDGFFVIAFSLEAGMKITALGWHRYQKPLKNRFAFWNTTFNLAGFLYSTLWPSPSSKILRYTTAVQVWRAIRVLFHIERYQDIATAAENVIPEAMHTFKVLFIATYVWACLGMQCFGGIIEVDNTQDPPVFAGPRGDAVREAWISNPGYYANNFNDMVSSMVLLFEILIVNNWSTLANGFVAASPAFQPAVVRLFFIAWVVLGNQVFLNIVLSLLISTMSDYLALNKKGPAAATSISDDGTRALELAQALSPAERKKLIEKLTASAVPQESK